MVQGRSVVTATTDFVLIRIRCHSALRSNQAARLEPCPEGEASMPPT